MFPHFDFLLKPIYVQSLENLNTYLCIDLRFDECSDFFREIAFLKKIKKSERTKMSKSFYLFIELFTRGRSIFDIYRKGECQF